MMLASSALLLVLPFLAGLNAAQASRAPAKTEVRCPDEVATTGYYRNYSYGFSISIPSGLKGFWNSARCVKDNQDCVCMGDHGRFIPIDETSYLQVFVEVQNEETVRESIDEEVRLILRTQENHGERAEMVRKARLRLGGLLATRLTIRYRSAKTAGIMIQDHILCPPPIDRYHGGFIYSVTLSTPEDQYAKRKGVFYSIIRSWRFRSVP